MNRSAYRTTIIADQNFLFRENFNYASIIQQLNILTTFQASDTFNCSNSDSSTSSLIESAKKGEESIEHDYNSPHVESEVIQLSDNATFTFGTI